MPVPTTPPADSRPQGDLVRFFYNEGPGTQMTYRSMAFVPRDATNFVDIPIDFLPPGVDDVDLGDITFERYYPATTPLHNWQCLAKVRSGGAGRGVERAGTWAYEARGSRSHRRPRGCPALRLANA